MNNLPRSIQAFVEATNRGDSDAFVAAFTQDALIVDWGRSFRGHDGVRAWNETDNIGVQAHFDVVDCTQTGTGESWVVTLRVTGNGYNGTGPMTFELRQGLIAELRIE